MSGCAASLEKASTAPGLVVWSSSVTSSTCFPSTPPDLLTRSSAILAPVSAYLPLSAAGPVTGSTMPTLIVSSAARATRENAGAARTRGDSQVYRPSGEPHGFLPLKNAFSDWFRRTSAGWPPSSLKLAEFGRPLQARTVSARLIPWDRRQVRTNGLPRLASEVYDRGPDFFKLYRMPRAYRGSLAQANSTVALSPGIEFLRLLLTAIAPIAISIGNIAIS